MKKLSKTELEYMKIIWDNPHIKSESIYKYFSQANGTKSTILHRIAAKGFVSIQQVGRHYEYVPLISREEYESTVMTGVVEKMEKIIAQFIGKTDLTQREIERIEQFLSEMNKEDDK